MKSFKYILIPVLLTTVLSCKKYVDVDPPRTELAQASVFVNDKTATAAMVGVYSDMNGYNYQFANIMTMFMGSMSADDFTYASSLAGFDEFKNNTVSTSNSYVNSLWSEPYDYIYRSNAIIEGVTASGTLSTAVKNQLHGEALFVRAFCHFYLVNIFGDVPLILNTDVLKNTNLPRTASAEVYKQIIADLTAAQSSLNTDYPADNERTRPTKAAATLLLARAYLYTGNFAGAETAATEVITNSNYNLLQGADMNNTFLKNSREAIWQLQPVNVAGNRNTWEGFTMTPASLTAPVAYYRLTKDQYGLASAFETGDLRKANWTGSYNTTATPPVTITYPYKYKVRTAPAVTEYSMVLRFAEAYLIRAEARIRQNKLAEGKEDLDMLRKRAGLAVLPVRPDVMSAMLDVEQERRVELFAEWGHRWFDLKRWKSLKGDATKTRADDILPLTKPLWKSTAILMPIPSDAIKTNNSLVQNPGYN
jgi:hypothetical protein